MLKPSFFVRPHFTSPYFGAIATAPVNLPFVVCAETELKQKYYCKTEIKIKYSVESTLKQKYYSDIETICCECV